MYRVTVDVEISNKMIIDNLFLARDKFFYVIVDISQNVPWCECKCSKELAKTCLAFSDHNHSRGLSKEVSFV